MQADVPFNPLISAQENQLPWLQDTPEEMVWSKWEATWRDVRILDAQNRLVAVFNLSDNDLFYPENRATLKQLFLDAAKAADADKDGLPDVWELHYFGNLSSGSLDDPDKDGANNFSEFALGTNPVDPKSKPSVKWELASKNQRTFLSVAFRRQAGGFANYTVEGSADLVHWNALDAAPSQAFRNFFDGTGTGEAAYQLSRPIQDQRFGFLRIRAAPK